jgi:hypothetical protein
MKRRCANQFRQAKFHRGIKPNDLLDKVKSELALKTSL